MVGYVGSEECMPWRCGRCVVVLCGDICEVGYVEMPVLCGSVRLVDLSTSMASIHPGGLFPEFAGDVKCRDGYEFGVGRLF